MDLLGNSLMGHWRRLFPGLQGFQKLQNLLHHMSWESRLWEPNRWEPRSCEVDAPSNELSATHGLVALSRRTDAVWDTRSSQLRSMLFLSHCTCVRNRDTYKQHVRRNSQIPQNQPIFCLSPIQICISENNAKQI